LLILDDPFSGLDKKSRANFLRNLRKLMKSRLQIILLSTRVEDLPSGITHLLRVKDCRMISVGPKHRAAKTITNRDHSAARARCPASNSKPGTEPLIELRNVTVRYGRAIILKGVNWKVRAGQSWALLGPNGSGKTTLLSLLLGDHPQVYQNDVRLFGKPRGAGESIWELKQRIGWVSPEMHLHFDETVTCFEAVASGFHDTVGLFEPSSRAQEKSTRLWLKRFDLAEWANEPLFALSAGQQRMALLARALVKNPRLLVLDEPGQGLDSAHRQLFLRTIDRLLRQGKETAIYVTHCEDEIPRSITRILRLSNGRARVVS
jgi:molybdate transport system ATP-binding protein